MTRAGGFVREKAPTGSASGPPAPTWSRRRPKTSEITSAFSTSVLSLRRRVRSGQAVNAPLPLVLRPSPASGIQQSPNSLGRGCASLVEEVAITVQGKSGGRVTKAAADSQGVDPLLDQVGDMGMPDVVEADSR